MDQRAKDLLLTSTAMLLLMLSVGCAAPWLPDYDVATFDQYRIDVLDTNNSWNPAKPSSSEASDGEEEVPLQLAGEPTVVAKSPTRIDVSRNYPSNIQSLSLYDLGVFNVRFSSSNTKNFTQAHVAEIKRVLRFSPIERKTTEFDTQTYANSATHVDFSYGAQYFLFDDSFLFGGRSDLFAGTNNVNTDSTNQSFGPQIGLQAATKFNGWNFMASGSLMLGMATQRSELKYSWGEYLLTGSPNQPENSQPVKSALRDSGSDFSTIGEILAQASYQLNDSLAFHLGYSAMHFGNIRSAEDSVQYRLPDWGLQEAGAVQTVSIDGLYARLEFRH